MAYPLKAAVIFQGKTNLPEDVFVNTFSFVRTTSEAPPSDADMSAISQALTDFYLHNNDVPSGPVRDYLANVIVDNPDPDIRFYGILGGSPIGHGSLLGYNAFGTPPPKSLPAEVALCLSIHGDLSGLYERIPLDPPGPKGDQRPKARHRGRIYFGPLTVNAMATFGDGATQGDDDARPSTGITTALRLAANRLMTNGGGFAMNGWQWAVHSRKNGESYPVVGGWIDNAFDTQRRRGLATTSRVLWP